MVSSGKIQFKSCEKISSNFDYYENKQMNKKVRLSKMTSIHLDETFPSIGYDYIRSIIMHNTIGIS